MALQNTVNPIISNGFDGVNAGNPSLRGDYIFANLAKPDIGEYITYKFPQYSLNYLLTKIGRKDPIVNRDSFSWFEKGLLRKAYAVGSGSSNLTTATATVKVLSATVANIGLLVNDVVRFENGDFGRITAVTQSSSDVDLTVVKAGGSANFALSTGMAFAHLYNVQPEYSDSPNGRVWQEEEVTEKLAIMRRSIQVSTTTLTNQQWVKGPNGEMSYYYINEMETAMEVALDREMYILHGTSFGTLSTTAPQSGNGIIPRVLSGGVVGTYSSVVTETDIQDQIRLLTINSPASEFTVLCGSKFYLDAQRALAPYVLNGNQPVGTLSSAGKMVGLNITQYTVLGKVINLVHYVQFDNPSLHPTPAVSGIDYSRAALFLNTGTDERGNPLIGLKYKADDLGNTYDMVRTVQSGISSPERGAGAQRSNGKDGFTVDFYCSIGVKLVAANNHGMMFAG